jgi:hypothetical protein
MEVLILLIDNLKLTVTEERELKEMLAELGVLDDLADHLEQRISNALIASTESTIEFFDRFYKNSEHFKNYISLLLYSKKLMFRHK